MAIATTNARVSASLSYVDRLDNSYLAIGKTTPWLNESAPPAEDPDISVLQEVIGYKKVEKVSLCKLVGTEPTSYPTVTYGGKTYALIPKDKAYQEKATLVYYETSIMGDELPNGTYRQVGIHTNLIPKAGITKRVLLPSEVQSTGTLQFFENKQFQNRTLEIKITERFILSVTNTQEIIKEG